MESFYSLSDMHLGLMLWVGTEYLICAVFSCNLSHLYHPVCRCDLFRIFWHLKKKVSKNTTMSDCFTISQISAFLLAALLSFPPNSACSLFLASVQTTRIDCIQNLACQMNSGHILSAISRGHFSYLRWERKYWHKFVCWDRSQIFFFFFFS